MDRQIQVSLVEDVARQLISLVDSTIPGPTAENWVNERYRDLCGRYKARHLRDLFQVYMPAPMTTGTVSVQYDSPFVTPDMTAASAWQNYTIGGGPGFPATATGPECFVGWYFRLFSGRVWYKIIAIDPNTKLMTLDNPFSQDTNSNASGTIISNVAYYILPRFIDLDPSVRFVSTLVIDSWFREIPIISSEQLDIRDPARWLVAFPPQCAAQIGRNNAVVGDPIRLEFYPYPQVSTTAHYVGYRHPPYLLSTDQIPPTIDDQVLLEGTLEKAYRWMAFQCGNPRNKAMFNIESAALFLNMANQQNTKWDQMWSRAARNDRSTDDLTMVLRSGRWNRGPYDWDPVQTATQQWLASGPFVIN